MVGFKMEKERAHKHILQIYTFIKSMQHLWLKLRGFYMWAHRLKTHRCLMDVDASTQYSAFQCVLHLRQTVSLIWKTTGKNTSWSMSMNAEFRSFHLSEVNINQALGERYIPKPRPPPFLYHLPPPFHTSLDIIYNSDGGPVAVLPPWPWCTIMETTPNATTIDINMLPLVLHKPLFILSSTWLHLSVPTYSTLSCRQPSLQWPTLSWVLCLCFF